MFSSVPEASKLVPHLVSQWNFENQVVHGGTLRWFRGPWGLLGGRNCLSRIFQVNFNYQWCLENSNMINFWLTSWFPLWGKIFLVFSLFHFFTRHFEFSLLCTLKWCVSDFLVNFNYQRCPEHSNMINFWLTSWVPSWGHIFLVFSLFFTFLPVTLNIAYFAPLNDAGWIFPVNFNYQRCLKNSNMINFWLTSWVTLWGQIFFSFFTFFPGQESVANNP